jgi:long-chain acyl-CoA synthetase
MEKIWLKQYPEGVAHTVDIQAHASLVALMDESFVKYRDRCAYRYMGRNFTFGEVDEMSRQFAAFLQAAGLAKGDRVALMMPNVPQYPVAVAGVLRAGCVVVNVNPLYTPPELEHQIKDSGARAIVVIENFAITLQHALPALDLKLIVTTGLGDLLGFPKAEIVNFAVRHIKKLVPSYDLPRAVGFRAALSAGRHLTLKPVDVGHDDIAVLQYTGGTTGVSKGAMLLHRNLLSNILQSEAWYGPALKKLPAGEALVTVSALPLYHVFGFTTNLMLNLRLGGCNILIANPRDIKGLLKDLIGQRFHSFPAVNTLFRAVAAHPDSQKVDWSRLIISVGGGAAVQSATAELWLKQTGCPIVEGYGLSETSPLASCNAVDSDRFTGTIGLPVSSTEMKLLDDEGREMPTGEAGEIAIRGPQVMAGYWQRPDETAQVMTADGFFRTGDIGVVDERGYFRIIDRKKDMIDVNGFKVYPNEVEEVVSRLSGVAECAVVGVPNAKSGETVKLVIVRAAGDPIDEAQVRAHCEANLAAYKRPRLIEFRSELPKSNVGKVLRRELRERVSG